MPLSSPAGSGDFKSDGTVAMTGALNWSATQTIASDTTTDIGAATSNSVIVSGTTTITALGTIAAGAERVVQFSGALTLTHNATSLILPGGASITTAAGDVAYFVSLGTGNWCCTGYQKANGQPVAGGGGASKYQLGAAWSGSGMALVAATADRVARTVPATGTIKKCTVLGAGGPGSVVVDIWRNTYAAYPPTVADTIVASSKPTITAAHKSVDSTLTGWSTAVTAGDVLLFVINSASTLTAAQVILEIEL